MKTTVKLVATLVFTAGSMTATAAAFDGSKTLLCALQQVNECETGSECVRVRAQEVNMTDFLQVDVGNKVISTTPEAGTERTTPIERSENLDGKLILQGGDDGVEGARDGLAWSMVINDSTGKMIISAAGDGVAFAIFGVCTLR